VILRIALRDEGLRSASKPGIAGAADTTAAAMASNWWPGATPDQPAKWPMRTGELPGTAAQACRRPSPFPQMLPRPPPA